MIHKHKKLNREKGKENARYSGSKKGAKESKDQTCFKRGKSDHFKNDYYKLKSKQPTFFKDKIKKSKALLTQSDDDEEESASSDDFIE